MKQRIEKLLSRLNEIEALIGQPEIFQNQKKYRTLTQEHAHLTEMKASWDKLQFLEKQLADNEQLIETEQDDAFIHMLEEDIQHLRLKIEDVRGKLEDLLVPPDPNDHCNTILELRAGTGGDEAALFVGDCVRMYKMFADRKGWKYEELSSTPSEVGGFKEYIMVISGNNVYRYLKNEGGTHRVQRVPETEAQGRVHTSAITVATLLEPDEEADIAIDEKDLRIDTYRASGAGGQHVNVTDSAVRITHLPTGIVVASQEERSQHKNKEKAMRLLKAKIVDQERVKKKEERDENRAKQVGTGDRSERIRTYNFPQNRVSDHRIKLTLYHLDRIMQGCLEEIINPLIAHFHQKRLQANLE